MTSHQKKDLAVRNMAALSERDTIALGKLHVSKWQEIKGGSFAESIEAWGDGGTEHVLGLFFVLEDYPIGMTLFKRPPLSPSWVSADAASIHGLKISTPWQRQGFGHKAFELAIHALNKEWPDITKLMLAVDTDNAAAIAIYRAFGMVGCEHIRVGRNGAEQRFEKLLLS